MRNHQTQKGTGQEGSDYSRPRRGTKRKIQQSANPSYGGSSSNNYASGSTSNVANNVPQGSKFGQNIARATSSRSHSNNHQGNVRKAHHHSVKKTSSKAAAAQLNMIKQSNGRKDHQQFIHVSDPALESQIDPVVVNNRSSSKMKQKHRKLTRQASSVAGRNDMGAASPSNPKKSNDNQFFKLQTAIQNSNHSPIVIPHELISSSSGVDGGQNFQHILEKQSFVNQPDFIVSGQSKNVANGTTQTFGSTSKAIPVLPNARNESSSSPAPFHSSDKQARTFNLKSTTPQGLASQPENGKLSASGKFVIAGINSNSTTSNSGGCGLSPDRSAQVQLSFELSRQQQMLQQQVRQQQNYKQHMQNVHLEVKGSPAAPVQQHQSYVGGPKPVVTVPQSHISSNLSHGVALQPMSNSPRLPEMNSSPNKGQSIFVHLTGGKANASSRTQQVSNTQQSINKTLETQQTPHFESQLGGLQNSKSPFKPKQSHKLLRSSIAKNQNQNSIRDSIIQQQASEDTPMPQLNPVEVGIEKKQTSARNPIRKQSGKNKESQNVYSIKGSIVTKSSLPVDQASSLSNYQQKNISLSQVQTKKASAVTAFGQKNLKTQTSHSIVGSSPEKLAAKQADHQVALRCKGNFFATEFDSNKVPELVNANQAIPQNMSGLLNMTKQRAYTMDADQQAVDSLAFEGQPANELNSVVPGDFKLPQTNQQQATTSSSKKAFKVKHEKQRSDSQQQNNRPTKASYHQQNVPSSSLSGGYNTSTKNNSFGKKTSLALIGSEGGSFQKSGKQIIQGKQQLLHHQQKQMATKTMNDHQANQAISQNKTLPLSIFEMQFYKGDFVLQSQLQQQAQANLHSTKANYAMKPQNSTIHQHQMQQQSQYMKMAANGIIQPQQCLPLLTRLADSWLGCHPGRDQSQDISNVHKQTSTTQDSHYNTPQQEVTKASLLPHQQHSINSQWLVQHASPNIYVHQQMPKRNSGGSQSILGPPVHQQHALMKQSSNSSPIKNFGSASKHHHAHNLSLTASASSQGITMQNLLQQNKGHLPTHLLQQHMLGSGSSQGQLYGGPVQVNGRQMSMANQTLHGINPQNFQSIMQPQSINTPLMVQHPGRIMQSEMHQAYMNGVTDPFELIHLQNQVQEHFSHQLYALQLQTQQKQVQQGLDDRRKRRDTNIFKRAVSKIPFENAYVEDCYKFIIGYGNNSGIIRNALKQRSWWIEIQPVHSMFNFKWNPVSDGIKFARLGHIEPVKREQGAIGIKTVDQSVNMVQERVSLQMVNHMEHHQQLTEKYNLLMVMQRFCDLHKENTFDLMPITFFVEIPDASKDQLVTQALTPFSTLWHTLEANKNKLIELKDILIRQLHHKIELEEKEANDVATGGKPNQALADKLLRLESVTGAQAQSQNSGKITKFKTFNFQKSTYQKYTMPQCHFDSYNLWLLKPTHLNRGRGIHVFNDLDTLNKLIKQYCSGKEEVTKKKESQPKESPEKADVTANSDLNGVDNDQTTPLVFEADMEDFGQNTTQASRQQASPQKKLNSINKIKHNTFIIQKYIERPLLIYKRKFDIRVWVLLSQDHDLFFFKEGYLRTSSTEFGIDLENIDNAFVHLTNNAVQKHAENYGDFEDGNQLSFKAFQDYIDKHYAESGVNVYDHLVPQMHEVILKTFNAVRRTIDPNRRKFCFELFGYDFILDEEFNMWLIEVNTNPCLEESSDLLKRYLPRMIEDMLRLTVDVVFPKNSIRKRKDYYGKKNKAGVACSPMKNNKAAGIGVVNDFSSQSPAKRVGTANKKTASVQLQGPIEDQRYRMGGNTDTEQQHTPISKDAHQFNGSKTNSTDATSLIDNGLRSQNQQASDPSDLSDFNRDGQLHDRDEGTADKQAADSTQLMTIKEKLCRNRTYPVPGYSDSQNMWHRLGNIEKDQIQNQTKFSNKRSVYVVQVQDKIFKLRKNPAYSGPLNLPELVPDPCEEAIGPEAIAEEEYDAGGDVSGEINDDL